MPSEVVDSFRLVWERLSQSAAGAHNRVQFQKDNTKSREGEDVFIQLQGKATLSELHIRRLDFN